MAQETLNMYRNELNTIFENYLQPIQSIIQKEKDSQAIIEYDATNPYFSYWYYEYLNSKSLDANCVKMIIMIGDVDEDDIENIKAFYPSAQITVIDKNITDITLEDLYIKQNFVVHSFGNLFLKYKATFHKTYGINNEYETVARRPELENLTSIVNNSRFFYNFFIGLKDNDDFDWQFNTLKGLLKYDYEEKKSSSVFFTFGNVELSTLRWYDEYKNDNLNLKIFFYDKKYPDPEPVAWLLKKVRRDKNLEIYKDILALNFWYKCPLKKTPYLENLSRRSVDNVIELLKLGNTFEDIKECDSMFEDMNYEVPFLLASGNSPRLIASEFNCLLIYQLYKKNELLFKQLVETYENAANDGIYEAYNNLGIIFYVIGEKEESRKYFMKGQELNVENAILNLYYYSNADERLRYEQALQNSNGSISLWASAISKWRNNDHKGAVNIFHELQGSSDAKNVYIENKSIADHSLNNLFFYYLYGVEEFGIKPNLNKLQQIATECKRVNPEALAVFLNDNIFKSDNNTYFKNCFNILTKEYRNYTSNTPVAYIFDNKLPWERQDKKRIPKSLAYNMACCYEKGLGCEHNRQKAIDVCKSFIEEQGDCHEILAILGELYFLNENYDKAVQIWSRIEKKTFKDSLNIAYASSKINSVNDYSIYEDLYENIDFSDFNVRKLLNSESYFERLDYSVFYNKNPRFAPILIKKAVENNIIPSFFYLARMSDNHETKLTLLKRYVMYGGRNGWGISEFIGRLLINKQIKEALHFMLLYEQSKLKKEYSFKYHIYNLLPLVSRIKDEEFLWLNKAAMNHNERAAIEYSKYLKNKGDIISAINYLNNYLQYEETIKELETIESLDYYYKDGFEDDYLPSVNLEGIQSVLDGYYYQLDEQGIIANKSDYVKPQPNFWYYLNDIKQEDTLSVGIQCMCYHFWEKYESKESTSQQNVEEDRDEYINRTRNEYYDSGEDYERDRWDALTDGQYGDFPGGDIDYDNFGY